MALGAGPRKLLPKPSGKIAEFGVAVPDDFDERCLKLGQLSFSYLVGDFRADSLKELGAQSEHLVTQHGALEQYRALISGVRAAANVPEALEVRDGLGCRLLADPKPASELGHRDAISTHRLQRESVDRARCGMTGGGELAMELVDDRSKRADEQQWQFPSACSSHLLWIVTGLANSDNQVYDLVNQVVDQERSMGHVIKRADARTTATPNATMTTLASPTLGATSGRSLWLVDMTADATGPLHVFDTEQIWTLLDGEAAIEIAGVPHTLDAGDTVVIPAGAERQVHANIACRMLVTGEATAIASVPGESESRGTPAWIS